MAFPRLRVPSASRQMIETFGGYNHNLRIGDGEFYDMKNLTSDDYPLLATRRQRGVYATVQAPTGLIAKDALCYVDGTAFVINEERVEMELNQEPKQLISMGTHVIILPDKKYINTHDVTDFGNIDARTTTDEPVTISLCRVDSSDYTVEYAGATEPPKPSESTTWPDRTMWIDTSTTPNVLKQWSSTSAMWIQIASTYVKIKSTGIGKAFDVYDGINISGLAGQELHTETGDVIEDTSELSALEGSAVVWDKGDDYIVIVGMISNVWTITDSITIERSMPNMDFVIECGNRLWGCRYGMALNGEVVNEIYCSKLGDFKNWNCFMGISNDSWVGGVGTDGPFTGAIAHQGYPLFFKENYIHKVYISSSGAHQVADHTCRGVQEGCHHSLAIVGEVVYYKARNGICAYDGSLPMGVSQAFGNVQYKNAVAGAYGNKYYVSMQDAEGNYHLFVYDAAKGMWHREDELQADCFCNCRDDLYCIESGTGRILTMLGSGEKETDPVEWLAESGMIGLSMPDMKYISRLILRLELPEQSQLSCYAEYDSSGNWEQLFAVEGQGTRTWTLPVRPVRCDHMRLRLEGLGPMKLFSITKTVEKGSDVR